MDTKVTFKKVKKKQVRKRRASSENESDTDVTINFREKLEETKEIQKLRKRSHGVSAESLAEGAKETINVKDDNNSDPFKLKTGGVIDINTVKKQKNTKNDPELDAVDLGNTFSAETNARDEDADMVKYIEEELAKKKGVKKNEDEENEQDASKDVLYQVSEHLRQSSSKKSEEMLSNQMLSGIPEVDLGIQAKIKNIEATEEAKTKMLQDHLNRRENTMSFVPTNMAVNFVHHNRFTIKSQVKTNDTSKNKKEVQSEVVACVGEDDDDNNPVIREIPNTGNSNSEGKKNTHESTDDLYYEKYRKFVRRR